MLGWRRKLRTSLPGNPPFGAGKPPVVEMDRHRYSVIKILNQKISIVGIANAIIGTTKFRYHMT